MEVFIENSGYSFLLNGKKHFIEYGKLVEYRVNIREQEYYDLEDKQRNIKEKIEILSQSRNKLAEMLSPININDLTPKDIKKIRWTVEDIGNEILELEDDYAKNVLFLELINTEIHAIKSALTSTDNRNKLSQIVNKYFVSDSSQTFTTKFFISGKKIQYVFVLNDEFNKEAIDIYKTLNPLFLYDLYMVINNNIGFALCIECSRLIRYKRNTVKYCDSCKYKSDQKKQKKIQPHNALCNKLRRRIKFRNDNYASILRLYQDAYGQYSRRYSYNEVLAFIHAVNEKTKSRDYNDIEDFRKFLNEYKPKKEGESHETS